MPFVFKPATALDATRCELSSDNLTVREHLVASDDGNLTAGIDTCLLKLASIVIRVIFKMRHHQPCFGGAVSSVAWIFFGVLYGFVMFERLNNPLQYVQVV